MLRIKVERAASAPISRRSHERQASDCRGKPSNRRPATSERRQGPWFFSIAWKWPLRKGSRSCAPATRAVCFGVKYVHCRWRL